MDLYVSSYLPFPYLTSLTYASIEGAVTIGAAMIGYFLVLDFPDQILASGEYRGFTQHELEVVLDRVERDRGDAAPDKLTWQKFWTHVLNWQLWIYGLMFMTCSAPIYAFAYFIQTILGTMGYSTSMVFLLCAPPYLFSIFWTVFIAWAADRTRLRMPWMALNAAITLTGLLITAYHSVSLVSPRVCMSTCSLLHRTKAFVTLASSSGSQVAMETSPPSSPSKPTTSSPTVVAP